MTEKLTPPAEVAVIEAAPPVETVEAKQAPELLPDLSSDQLLDLRNRANTWVGRLTALVPKTPEFQAQIRAIQNVARAEITQSSDSSSRFLDLSLAQAKAKGGGAQTDVAKSLVDLRNKVEELAPANQSFLEKLVSILPGSKQLQRYFRQYETNQEQLNTVLLALGRGQDTLRKDNASLAVERKSLWETMGELKKLDALLAELDTAVTSRIAELRASGDEALASGLETEALFAVRQRRMDVQTQLAVSVQAYLSMDLIQDNNLKLIDGVERAKTTTMTALRTAVIVAQALENQKLVLDQIEAVNSTTNSLIDQTSRMLRDNVARTQEQATNSGVSLETLQRAYDNLFATIDQVESFRTRANAHFATTIDRLEEQLDRSKPYLERARRSELSEGEPALAIDSIEGLEAALPPELNP